MHKPIRIISNILKEGKDKISQDASKEVIYKIECKEYPSAFIRQIEEHAKATGDPTNRFGKLSVRKALNPLQFSENNFRLELS